MRKRAWDRVPMVKLLRGHVLDVLRGLPADSVHCVVTSPPYWGLRSYKTEPQVWGGESHTHLWGAAINTNATNHTGKARWQHTRNGRDEEQPAEKRVAWLRTAIDQGAFCACGAWHGELGLEPTIELYVSHLVDVFREVRRVLRPDGTLWLNISDSYASSGGHTDTACNDRRGVYNIGKRPDERREFRQRGHLKPKDMCMIPARAAMALQAEGWWLRRDIVWHKPGPMPESAGDRPTTAHEFVFLLSKSESYFYDGIAIAETCARFDERQFEMLDCRTRPKRNARSVWRIASEPTAVEHFATYPRELAERCILAGTSARGACAECGAPWERLLERTGHVNRRELSHTHNNSATKTDSTGWAPLTRDSGRWAPTCEHASAPAVPCTVLDPFSGTGTTGVAALWLGRDYVGIELQPDYHAIAERRLTMKPVGPLFEEVAP